MTRRKDKHVETESVSRCQTGENQIKSYKESSTAIHEVVFEGHIDQNQVNRGEDQRLYTCQN